MRVNEMPYGGGIQRGRFLSNASAGSRMTKYFKKRRSQPSVGNLSILISTGEAENGGECISAHTGMEIPVTGLADSDKDLGKRKKNVFILALIGSSATAFLVYEIGRKKK